MKIVSIYIFLFCVWSLSFSATKPEQWSVAVADFNIDSRALMPQRDVVFFTEYLTNLLEKKSKLIVKSRYDVGMIIADPSISQKTLLRDASARTGVDAIVTATISKRAGGGYIFNFLVVSKRNDDETFKIEYNDKSEESLETQMQSFVTNTIDVVGEMVEGRAWYLPPNFAHIRVGFDAAGFVGENKKNVVNNLNPSIYTTYYLRSGKFSFSLSRYVFASIAGAELTATDRFISTSGIIDAASPEYLPAMNAVFGNSPAGAMFDRVRIEANRDGTFVRRAASSYYLGGGLGIRIWKFRVSGEYLLPYSQLDKKEKVSDLNPKSLIFANADVYLVSSIYAGVSYALSNSAGVIDNNLAELYPTGIPNPIDKSDAGVKRRNLMVMSFRIGVEL